MVLTLLVVTAALAATVVSASAAATLTGHWTFDQGSGTIATDSSGGGHPLTLRNGASWGPGEVGPYALSVDGNQQSAETSAPVIDTTHRRRSITPGTAG